MDIIIHQILFNESYFTDGLFLHGDGNQNCSECKISMKLGNLIVYLSYYEKSMNNQFCAQFDKYPIKLVNLSTNLFCFIGENSSYMILFKIKHWQ